MLFNPDKKLRKHQARLLTDMVPSHLTRQGWTVCDKSDGFNLVRPYTKLIWLGYAFTTAQQQLETWMWLEN